MVIEKTATINRKRTLNPFDAGIIVVALLAGCGFLAARSSLAGVNSVIQQKGAICIDVMFTGVKTLDTNIFKIGDKSAITVRNQPVDPPMTITRVLHWPKQVSFLSPDGKKAVAMPDPANPTAHDFLVTVQEDNAERTKDGWVIRGNKIKLGSLVELESDKYRIQGVIADIHSPDDAGNATAVKELENQTNSKKVAK